VHGILRTMYALPREAMPRRKHREVIEEMLALDGARVADIGCGAERWPRPQQSPRR